MTYEQARQYVISTYGGGRKCGLEIVRGVLACLGNPHNDLRVIHVAGTNGKGSVCALLSSVLKEAGYKTGFYSSPHLHSFNERFRIDGEVISDEKFAVLVEKVKTACHKFFGNETDGLSYFEFLTVMMFCYFRDSLTQYVLMEAGIGGRLDATNVVDKPILSVITAIGFDHTEYLGDTIEKIAAEKAGIIKKNCPVVLSYQNSAVYNVVRRYADEKNSLLYYDASRRVTVNSETSKGLNISVVSDYFTYSNLDMKLCGDYQIENCLTALLALEALKNCGNIMVSEQAARRGISVAKWPGRMEVISDSPTIIVDGAHNNEAIESLYNTLRKYFHGHSITLVLGILKDKTYNDMVVRITELSENIVLTKPIYDARAAQPGELLECFNASKKNILLEDDCTEAIEKAIEINPKDGVIVVCGSLYLVGDIRKHILNKYGGIFE